MKEYKKLLFFSFLLALIVAVPALIILAHIFVPSSQTWRHLEKTVLFLYAKNSLYIMLSVGFFTALIGFSTAWLTSIYDFRFCKFLQYGLILPFAFPTYIAGYIYSGMLGLNGSITHFILRLLGKKIYEVNFHDIMSLSGAIFVMSFVLYPYVYIVSKAYLKSESGAIIDASKSLGLNMTQIFFKVILPLARPAIVAGLILSVMESVSDYGMMTYYGVSTFVTGIFRTWLGAGSLDDASKLASILMIVVFALIYLEKTQRKNIKYKSSGKDYRPLVKIKLKGFKAFLAFGICFVPFFLGFLLPFVQMCYWFLISYKEIINASFEGIFYNTFFLALFSAFIITMLGLFFVYAIRRTNLRISEFFTSIVKLGYSIPGAVTAVGILSFLAFFDNTLYEYLKNHFGYAIPFLLGGTIFALVFGYSVRMLAISINYFESGFEGIPKSYDDAGKTMNFSGLNMLKKIFIPLLKSSIFASFIIVFIEVVKELPLTMILRPFNFNTLAVETFVLTGQAQIIESAVPAMFIVLLGILSVILLAKNMIKEQDEFTTNKRFWHKFWQNPNPKEC